MSERATSRRRLLEAFGAAGAIGLAGCSNVPGTGPGDSGDSDRLTIGQATPPEAFDPIVLSDGASAQVVDQVVQGLYTYSRDGTEIVPELAAGEPRRNDDGTQWTVEIDGNATFQTGDPVTAEDVKYSFEVPVAEETANAEEVNAIDTVEVVGDRTVRFVLEYPYAAFEHVLTWYVVPKAVRESDPDAFAETPVGSGPFEFDGRQDGAVRLARWDDYWGDPVPAIEGVEFVTVERPADRLTKVTTGENDVVESVPPNLWDSVEDADGVSVEAVDAPNYFYVAFNCNEGPATDPDVREAVDYAVSLDEVVGNVIEPAGTRQYSPLPPQVAESWDMPVDEWEAVPHDRDLDRTKELLDGADVSDDWTATILVPPDDKRRQLGIAVANGLDEAGYGANVERLEWETFRERSVSGSADDYDVYVSGWSAAPDPDRFLYPLFSGAARGVTDGTFYGKVTDAVAEARRTPDRERRRSLYAEAVSTVLEDRAHLPAYGLQNSFGVQSYVRDFAAHPVEEFTLVSDWNNVSLE